MNFTDKEIRKLWRRWCASDTIYPMPEELRGLTCGAKTRKGTPCKQKGLYVNGRCQFHGGLSSGPRTDEGKRKSAQNGLVQKAKSMKETNPMKET